MQSGAAMTSESKHTPGPWTIFTDLPEEHDGYIDHGGYRINADGVEQLAYVWERSARVNPSTGEQDSSLPFGAEEAQANARLIASAPELLEALSDIIGSLEITWRNGYVAIEDVQKEVEFARSLISRARGE